MTLTRSVDLQPSNSISSKKSLIGLHLSVCLEAQYVQHPSLVVMMSSGSHMPSVGGHCGALH